MGRPVPHVLGKGRKPRLIAHPKRLAEQLRPYAYTLDIESGARFFPIKRIRVWGIVRAVEERAGFTNRGYICSVIRIRSVSSAKLETLTSSDCVFNMP